MTTLLPRDDDNHPIPALRLRPGGAHQLAAATGASTRTATAFAADTRVIGVVSDVDIYLQTGDATVTASATDHFLPAGLYADLSLGGPGSRRDTHVAVRSLAEAGTVHVSEKV
ncbi:MAG: hypothetical protein KDA49_03440 [Rhodospirillaceae bacterium]|nr:hypothetical protein [Rhodospirillaceae bacterium]MCA8931491.1 hypothetical protein [Rhodospirillaceae bacterium]